MSHQMMQRDTPEGPRPPSAQVSFRSAPGAQIRRTVRDPAEIQITVGAVEKPVGGILSKLRLTPSESGHPRVLAALAYLIAAHS